MSIHDHEVISNISNSKVLHGLRNTAPCWSWQTYAGDPADARGRTGREARSRIWTPSMMAATDPVGVEWRQRRRQESR
jgi:hypothetical protein